ncbi:MAG: UDP-N-acetylglucosamine 1-carboxyvinyltransferase [Phycisphaerales bacterium]
MDTFHIDGGRRLEGSIRVNGSKNAALPQMAAALLSDGTVTLRDVPDLADTRSMMKLLDELGCEVVASEPGSSERVLSLKVVDRNASHARYDIVRTMRASISVLGPLLARRGRARVAMPGGCAIGERPVDLHLHGLAALGAEIELDAGDIVATAPRGRLRGNTIFLGGAMGSTVLGTANVMSAAVLAEGTTVIESAACEPEIADLARLLNAMGARITGAGTPRVVIEGVEELSGAEHRVMPDRIEAGTFMCAAAITNGSLSIENTPLDAMLAVVERLAELGVNIEPLDRTDPQRATCRVTSERVLRPIRVTAQPYPGFPTDLQAQLMALLCLAEGNSIVTDKVFPERFLHVAELSRMGARLHREGATVMVTGVRELRGAPVMASDLRASASLVLAGLAAQGHTVVNRVYHLDRGYERFEERLVRLGASIRRVPDSD